jgi:hypothetical protein
MISSTKHTTVIRKLAHSKKCMNMQDVLCNTAHYVFNVLILWFLTRFLRLRIYNVYEQYMYNKYYVRI